MSGVADCIFCSIVAGDSPGTFVYRDEDVAAFMDIQPINPGHVLVLPVGHAPYLADLEVAVAGRLAEVGQRVAAAIRASGVRCEGIDLFLADGEAAGQEVLHVHLHVIPRYRGDGFGFRFGPDYASPPARDVLEEVGAAIRASL